MFCIHWPLLCWMFVEQQGFLIQKNEKAAPPSVWTWPWPFRLFWKFCTMTDTRSPYFHHHIFCKDVWMNFTEPLCSETRHWGFVLWYNVRPTSLSVHTHTIRHSSYKSSSSTWGCFNSLSKLPFSEFVWSWSLVLIEVTAEKWRSTFTLENRGNVKNLAKKKFLYPPPDSDPLQNMLGSSLIHYTSCHQNMTKQNGHILTF